jgi:hypothetical protein
VAARAAGGAALEPDEELQARLPFPRGNPELSVQSAESWSGRTASMRLPAL